MNWPLWIPTDIVTTRGRENVTIKYSMTMLDELWGVYCEYLIENSQRCEYILNSHGYYVTFKVIKYSIENFRKKNTHCYELTLNSHGYSVAFRGRDNGVIKYSRAWFLVDSSCFVINDDLVTPASSTFCDLNKVAAILQTTFSNIILLTENIFV